MIETVLGVEASESAMQEILEVYEDASTPVLNIRFLFSAMLERALLDLRENVATSNYEWFTDALIWFEGSSPTPDSFTFQQIISYLNFTQNQRNMIQSKIEEGKQLHARMVNVSRENVKGFSKSDRYLKKIVNETRTVPGHRSRR